MAPKFIKTIIRRVIINAIREGEIQRFDADGVVANEFQNRELFQQYGFSAGKSGMEGIVLGMGNVFFLIASDDRRYRVAREDGETVIYTDEGDKVHLKRDRIMELLAGAKIVLNAPAVELGDGTLLRLIDERFQVKFEAHKHQIIGVQAGAATLLTGVPDNAPLTLADIATTKTKGS